ncbi:MAG TPA: YibE/F family protein [Acidimicrobiia bacterium]|nr:YibE/F family protein [Acidimicrobiia bacterium]
MTEPGPERRNRELERFLEPERLTILRALPVVVAVTVAIATIVAMVVLRPTGAERPDLSEIGIPRFVYDAEVTAVESRPCAGTTDVPCVLVSFRLDEGPDAESTVAFEGVVSETSPSFSPGDDVVLAYNPDADPAFQYSYFDRQRRPVLLWAGILLVVVVIGMARLRGVTALLGLGASVVVILLFVVPAIIDGREPVAVAIVGAAAIAYLALYTAHGFSRMTTVALLGTLAALALTAVLAAVFIAAARFTGFTEDVSFILTAASSINIRGLLLAGVVLGSLGAIDDVTVTQASTVWELRAANPTMSRLRLFRAGMRVGRDHVASTVNTLLLAYAGAAMPLLLFFVLAGQSLGTSLNSEIVAIEVIRTVVGSIGLVMAVPFTTWLSAWMADDSAAPH